MTPTVLRRPLLPLAAVLAAVALTGAGYSAASPDPAAQTHSLTPEARASVAAQAAAAESDAQLLRAASDIHEAERRAQREAERLAEEKAARQAAKAAQEARQAEAARQAAAARDAAAARASREAARDPRGAARVMLADFGWGSDQFSCLDSLWTKESNWKHTADNPTSSAYGIPQALPGSKMASAGSDWRTNPVTQIRWGLGYIDDVYGSPCAAWSHSQAHNWY